MRYPAIPGTRVIGFGGPARAGKDTAATILFGIDPMRTMRYAFSDAISVYCRVAAGMTKRDPTLLQYIGYGQRQQKASVWLDALYWRIDEQRPRLAVITGVRFPDEIEMVREMGGALFWIDRVNVRGVQELVTDRDPNYPTETSVHAGMFDRTIINVTDREDLFRMRVLDAYASLR